MLYCSTFNLKFLLFSYIIVTLIERINEKLKLKIEKTYNAKRGGKQLSMFMSENICTLVNLFDKAVAEGASNHCGNDVGR